YPRSAMPNRLYRIRTISFVSGITVPTTMVTAPLSISMSVYNWNTCPPRWPDRRSVHYGGHVDGAPLGGAVTTRPAGLPSVHLRSLSAVLAAPPQTCLARLVARGCPVAVCGSVLAPHPLFYARLSGHARPL